MNRDKFIEYLERPEELDLERYLPFTSATGVSFLTF